MGERIKYIRVSTQEQNTQRQELDAGTYDRVYTDIASGKSTDRPQLTAMLAYIRNGDTVVVESYSRFARNTRDLLLLLEQLEEKGVAFISEKERIDTSTPQGRLMLTVFAGLAQFEREQLLQRQAEGIAIAKAQGRYKGRKPIPINQEAFAAAYHQWKDGRITAREAMRRLGLKSNTFYRRVAAHEEKLKKLP